MCVNLILIIVNKSNYYMAVHAVFLIVVMVLGIYLLHIGVFGYSKTMSSIYQWFCHRLRVRSSLFIENQVS